MQIIKVKPGQVFLLEVDSVIPENEKAHILKEWNKILPNNPIIIVKNGSLSILESDL